VTSQPKMEASWHPVATSVSTTPLLVTTVSLRPEDILVIVSSLPNALTAVTLMIQADQQATLPTASVPDW